MLFLGCSKSMHSSTVIKCFAASVRKLGSGLGISQEEFAERADLHRTYIAGMETETKSSRECFDYESPQPAPISQPARKTSTPPTTTWNTAASGGVSM